jgi:hypothetical protein
MNTKDESGKGGSAQSGAGGNRPHATLDLKATVVKPARSEQEAESEADAASARTASSRPDTGGSPPMPVKAPGSGGFFTHLAAGIAGGIFALLTAWMLASQIGFGGAASPVDLSPFEQRLAALETVDKQTKPDTAALDARIKAAEDKIGKLQGLAANVDAVSKKQDELAGDINAVEAKAGTQDAQAADARVTKLEQQLTAMSAAAESDPASGHLPQLAALTGKIADLESVLPAKLDALRKSVTDEIETRLAVANEAGESAKAGTQRLDREVSAIKVYDARLLADLNALKTESERASIALKTTADSLSGLRAEIEARLATFAKSSDIGTAMAPIATKLSALQDDVRGVLDSEEARRTTAQRIVLSLDLADLKRVIERGNPYAAELEHVRSAAAGSIDLAPLDRFANQGVPTLAELRQDFKSIAYKLIDTEEQPTNGSIMGRLLSGAKSVVRVRRINHSADDKTVEAIVSRMEAALNEDRLGDLLQEVKTLPQPAQDSARDFLAKVEARYAVDKALQTVETQLKSSLVAPAAAAGAAQR